MRFTTMLLRAALLLQSILADQVLGVASLDDSTRARCPSGWQIQRELGPRLSEKAAVAVPSSSDWDRLMVRAAAPRISPRFMASVEVATEKDVQETIKYANHIGVPFLVVSGGHGQPTTLNNLHCGIQINMRKMNDTTVSKDGKTATGGGGVMQHEIVASLFKQGKMAVTGLCECVSLAGPLLGGGHSMLQGRYGFSADNLVSARLVLANGSAVTASAAENPDLFWAIRGAGHNFGVATSLQVKVYDATQNWTMIIFTFTQDKLERFFNTWNRVEDENDDHGTIVLNGHMGRDPDIDSVHPVIGLAIFFKGQNNVIGAYTSAFLALGPVSHTTVTDIPYGDLYDTGGMGTDGLVCRDDHNILGYPSSFPRWDADAMRAGFALFSEFTGSEKFATSAWLLESYGRKGVETVPEDSNAVSPEDRRYHLLTSPMLWWAGDDEQDRARAMSFGKRMQTAVRRNSKTPPHAYVNYAFGGEPLPEVYGRDGARLARLKRLKAEYDPHNRFGFYVPIR
ncbi:hypothetical protein B0H66DRAFT_110470 [Apodospora peruviana]|uniref:FAD-binding PCMH-type domain-containing protein n=1 Tax=Apodospora peruviana TaxID=516989 RepID=A0AAE0IIS1_9PEZI|nr:hypothetical protein B0H66DRAFT_110470 [Apodospora peruviana]